MTENNPIFDLKQGEAVVLRYPVTDAEAGSLAGATAHWWMAKNQKSIGEDIKIQKSTGGLGIVIVEESGVYIVEVTINEEDTEAVPATKYYYELKIRDASGRPNFPADGTINLIHSLVTV